jgi:hypothetical protein
VSTDRETVLRQAVLWRTLATTFGMERQSVEGLERLAAHAAHEAGVPELVLDATGSIATVLQRYPELAHELGPDAVAPSRYGEDPSGRGTGADLDEDSDDDLDDDEDSDEHGDEDSDDEDSNDEDSDHEDSDDGAGRARKRSTGREVADAGARFTAGGSDGPIGLRRALMFGKLLVNGFGPNTLTPVVTAEQYRRWLDDVAALERALGYGSGGLRGRGGGPGSGGHLIGEEELRAGLQGLEKDLVRRMALQEVLSDRKLASQLTPSMALVEQLLREKSHLSDEALRNAKALIRRYVDELAEVLKIQVKQAAAAKVDNRVPPKRVFRNLDLKKTIWKNLSNWNTDERRLYVDRLFYRRTAKRIEPKRLVVVVDQSGSMVDAMVQCTILASIFAQLPHVDAHLIAFDTRVIDLTPWVTDPFEVLLRTQLGGGTHIRLALLEANKKIEEPPNTVMVLISDFYEGGSDQELLDEIVAIKSSGVHFVPVGAVTSSGSFSVHPWFRDKLKDLGTPILTGSVTKLISQLKALL